MSDGPHHPRALGASQSNLSAVLIFIYEYNLIGTHSAFLHLLEFIFHHLFFLLISYEFATHISNSHHNKVKKLKKLFKFQLNTNLTFFFPLQISPWTYHSHFTLVVLEIWYNYYKIKRPALVRHIEDVSLRFAQIIKALLRLSDYPTKILWGYWALFKFPTKK